MSAPAWVDATASFFSDGRFITIGAAMLGLFVLMFVTWWVYRSLSDRNLFTFLERHGRLPQPTLGDRVIYALRYIILFPLYSFLGFLIVGGSLTILIRPADATAQEQVLIVSLILIGTVRIAAYVSEGMAEDIAKAVPLTMLTAVIAHPTHEYLSGALPVMLSFGGLIPTFLPYLAFLAVLEVALRVAAWAAGKAGFDPSSEAEP